jgi:hypothetical protein
MFGPFVQIKFQIHLGKDRERGQVRVKDARNTINSAMFLTSFPNTAAVRGRTFTR